MKIYIVEYNNEKIELRGTKNFLEWCYENSIDDSSLYKTRRYPEKFKDVKGYRLIDIHNELDVVDVTKKELFKHNYRVMDINTEIRRDIRMESRYEDILSVLKEKINKVEFIPQAYKPCTFNKEAILLLSDWHYGLEFESSFSRFSPEIAEKMLSQMVYNVIDEIEGEVKAINVFNLGDLINGMIHVSTRLSNKEDTITQVIKVSKILTFMLVELSKRIEKVKYYSALCNHGRLTAKKDEQLVNEHFTRLIDHYISISTKNIPNIEIIEGFDGELIDTKILNTRVFGIHGNYFGNSASAITHNLTHMTRTVPDLVVLGHFHASASEEINTTDIVINPSLSGQDPFAKSIGKINKQVQKLLIIDEVGLERVISMRGKYE